VVWQWRQQLVGKAAASDVGVWWQWTLKVVVEAEMTTAANILLSSTSVIIVG
jgi:hypothetical protein